ncbi:MAG TPA: hypothetical protein VG929_09185 [Actinomycetota bacterium]|nr:hypothetical protein [Actinomycetota bacterium]
MTRSMNEVVRAVATVVVLLTSLIVTTTPAAAEGSADLSVTVTVYRGDRTYDRIHDGALVIGREYTFVIKVRNDGPNRTTATVRYDFFPTERNPAYTWWSVPSDWDGSIIYDDATSCNDFRCRLGIGPGQERWVVGVYADANAPGPATVEARVSSSVEDADLSNNSAREQRRVTCSITGSDSSDTLRGTENLDSICGGGGNDTLIGVGAGDKIFGGAGNDLMKGDRARQIFIGGRGTDTISYRNAGSMVFIFLREMTSNGWAKDQLIQPEIVIGSRYADYMEGSGRGERIDGWSGNDEIYGDSGGDVLVGGTGNDEFDGHDGARDVIRGGRGSDVAYTDSRDVRRSARYSSYRTFPDRS